MKKFELFMCCLGNGITVCNKAVQEDGDYKIIAHIANSGKIKWYVPISYVPGDDLLKIEHDADVQRVAWERWLDAMPESMSYGKLLEAMPIDTMLHVLHMPGEMREKIEYMKKIYYDLYL